MSTQRIRLCTLVIAAVLASCATIYAPHLSSDTASVRFVIHQSDRFGPDPSFLVAALSDEKCGKAPPAGRIVVFTTSGVKEAIPHKSLSMLGGDRFSLADKHEVQVPVTGRFSFVIRGNFSEYPMQSECTVAMSFHPQAGGQYEIEYRDQQASCAVRITRLLQTPEGKIVRSPDSSAKLLSCGYPGTF